MLELKLGGINVELVVSPSNQGLRRDAVYTDINETESIVKGVFFVREKTYFQLSLCCDRTMSGKAEMWVESPKRWARNRVLSFGLTPQRSLYRFSKWNGYRFRIGSRPKNNKSIGSIIIKVLEDGSDDPLQFIFELMHINPVKNPYDGGDDDDNNATYRPGRNSRRSTQVSSIEAPRCRFPRPQRHINLGIQNQHDSSQSLNGIDIHAQIIQADRQCGYAQIKLLEEKLLQETEKRKALYIDLEEQLRRKYEETKAENERIKVMHDRLSVTIQS